MVVHKVIVAVALAGALSVSGIFAADNAAAFPAPYLPGILQVDPAPQGCVSCHVNKSGDKDLRLNKMIEKIPGHPDLTKAFKGTAIPSTCFLCHKEGSKLGSLGPNLHRVHYEKLGASDFVVGYAGSCLNCHVLNEKNGAMGFKSGTANW